MGCVKDKESLLGPHCNTLLFSALSLQPRFLFILIGIWFSGLVGFQMERPRRVRMLLFVAVFMVVQRQSWPATADVAAKSKYQIECTMCSACDNPCNQVPSRPPPNPSPPPPSPPPPSSSSNCPPPPSPPSNPTYYYSPPPPSQPTYVYSPPLPNGYNGGGGGGGAFYPPPYQNYPAPPPPNPIVPYFPFWYHTPPPTSAANSVYFSDSTVYTIALISLLFCFL